MYFFPNFTYWRVLKKLVSLKSLTEPHSSYGSTKVSSFVDPKPNALVPKWSGPTQI